MQAILDLIVTFFGWINSLGATVILPIALFLIGLAFRVKAGQAFVNALKVGIGFFGLNVMIGVVAQNLGPVAQGIVERTGLQLAIPDVGVGLHFPITFAPAYAAFMIPLGILVNMVMLFLGLTKTVDIDVWNFWPWMFSWALVSHITGNPLLGFLAFVATGVVSLVLGDLQAKYIQEEYELPGITFPHPFSTFWSIFAWPFNWVFDRIPGFKDLQADTETLQKRLGPLGDSTVIGLIVGIILALLAGYGWIQTVQFGVVVAAILLLMPMMIKILVSGLFPISEAARDLLSKRFPGREYYIGLDCAVGVAQPSSLVVGVMLIPITLLLAAVLPGNRLLPLADLAFLAFWVSTSMAMFKNNIIRGLIYGTCMMAISLWMATSIAPLVTTLGVQAGFALPEGTKYVSCLTIYPWSWLWAFIAALFKGGFGAF